ncbi:putative transcription repressor PLATZ family [Helianthus debilis subsp. tardiflorus]
MESSSSGSTRLPTWLESLLSETFFNACMVHEDVKKNEKNIFCLDCCQAICHHCLDVHNSHRLLQIRRYVYHDVIRVGDAEKLMDCSYVQAYTTNSAKVVFLNPRPQTRACRNLSNNCISCERGLQDPYLFCSISCKVFYNIHIHIYMLCSKPKLYEYMQFFKIRFYSIPDLTQKQFNRVYWPV